MKKQIKQFGKYCIRLLALLAFSSTAVWADISLPSPQINDGRGIFSLLKSRHSATPADFPLKDISLQELSNLLWAATGQNRSPRGWTIPLAMNAAPYNTIYVLNNNGIYKYNWKQHTLTEVAKKNIKNEISPQSIVGQSPIVLVFVSKTNLKKEYAYTTTGAMTQNIYLAAESMGIECRFAITMKENTVHDALKLKANEYPLNLMLIGKK